MVELNDEQKEALEALKKWSEDKKNAPPSERVPVARPERYDFLIGFDDEGRKFPVSGEEEQEGR